MNLNVTIRAVRVLRVLVMLWTGRLLRSHSMCNAVARQAQMIHGAELQHSRIGGTVRHMTRYAAVSLNGSVFESEWPLLIRVALDTCGVGANSQARLF